MPSATPNLCQRITQRSVSSPQRLFYRFMVFEMLLQIQIFVDKTTKGQSYFHCSASAFKSPNTGSDIKGMYANENKCSIIMIPIIISFRSVLGKQFLPLKEGRLHPLEFILEIRTLGRESHSQTEDHGCSMFAHFCLQIAKITPCNVVEYGLLSLLGH